MENTIRELTTVNTEATEAEIVTAETENITELNVQAADTKVTNINSTRIEEEITEVTATGNSTPLKSKDPVPNNTIETEIVEEDQTDKKSTALISQENGLMLSPETALAISEQNKAVCSAIANSLMQEMKQYANYEKAEEIVNYLLRNGKAHVGLRVTLKDGGEKKSIGQLILEHKRIEIVDPLDPNKTAVIEHNNYYDGTLESSTTGKKYPIVFGVREIIDMLRHILAYKRTIVNKAFMLDALAENIAIMDLGTSDIANVIEKLVEMKFLEEFNNFRNEIKKAKFKQERSPKNIPEYELESLYLLGNYALVDNDGVMEYVDLSSKEDKRYTHSNLKKKFAKYSRTYINEATGRPKKMNPVDVYLESKYHIEYDDVVFDPSCTCDPSTYNLFKGYKYEPKKLINIYLYKQFVKETICNGDELMYNVVWSFLAHMFQHPHIKTGIALVLTSKKGAGKNSFVKPILELMSGYFITSTNHKRLLGDFNDHLETTLLYYANEAKFTDNVRVVNGLKNIITETEFTTEVKKGATYSTKNYTHLIIDANTTPVQQTEDERRFAHCDISEDRIEDFEFWKRLHDLYETEGFYESLMYDLMTHDYTPWKDYLRKPPVTKATEEQIKLSTSVVKAWWKYCLEESKIPYVSYDLTPCDELNITNEAKFQSFKKWCTANNFKHNLNLETFGKAFVQEAICEHRELETVGKITIDGKRINSKVYAQLSLCRKIFSENEGANNIDYVGEEWQIS